MSQKPHDHLEKKNLAYQSAYSHANNGPSEESEGVGCTTGLGPSKGPLTIAPRVHPEVFLKRTDLASD